MPPTNESSKFVGDQYEEKESRQILHGPSSPTNQSPPDRIRVNAINLLSYFLYVIVVVIVSTAILPETVFMKTGSHGFDVNIVTYKLRRLVCRRHPDLLAAPSLNMNIYAALGFCMRHPPDEKNTCPAELVYPS